MSTRPSRRDAIVQYISRYVAEHGFPPSVREIGAAVSLKSTSTVAYYLRRLEEEGRISRVHERSRGISLPREAFTDPDRVPLIGRVAAGLPLLADEQVEELVPIPHTPSAWFGGRPDFALRVRGDSMEGAGILDGDLAFVHQQDAADDGQIVVALLGEEATLKRFQRAPDAIRLLAENPRYAPIVARDVRILGVLVGIVRGYA
jgi:repressor LexA